MPVLGIEPAVMNPTVLPGVVSHPDGDEVHFDVLYAAALRCSRSGRLIV